MASALQSLEISGPVLVADDPLEDVCEALRSRGLHPVAWSRMDRPGAEGAPWPPPGPFGAALIRLPRSRGALEFALHAAVSVTAPGGRILVYGATDEGIASTPGRMEPLLGTVATRANARRCRVLEGRRLPDPPELRGSLEAWREVGAVDLGWGPIPWVGYPGCFAGGRLDPGTALLLSHLPPLEPGERALDFGAGTGVLAAALTHRTPGARLAMVEPDALARAAGRENVPKADFLATDSWTEAGPFRAVVSNPPYHAGKSETLEVVEALVAGSARALAQGGELRMVIQRRLPAEAILRGHFKCVETVADAGPYRVWRAAEEPV